MSAPQDALPYPIARVGLIGGGQLGRMTVQAASRIGCQCIVLDPATDCPAGELAAHQIIGGYHDAQKIRELAAQCDVVTYELENIDARTLAALEAEGKAVYPSAHALQIIQDKLTQKQFLAEHGIPTSPFEQVNQPDPEQFAAFGYPLVQKARRGGYDGRGVAVMQGPEDFSNHLPVPSLIEGFVTAEKEIAVMVARSVSGEVSTFPVVEMCVRPGENVLDVLLAPADLSQAVCEAALDIAEKAVVALDGIGIFGVEMFVNSEGNVLVNEIAPRTHNSGHHTIEANVTDQFEQHLRAILGLPLGSTDTLSPAAMMNLLGAPEESGEPELRGLHEALSIPGVSVHLYGKHHTSPYRKMGHVTVVDSSTAAARAKAEQVRTVLQIGARTTSSADAPP